MMTFDRTGIAERLRKLLAVSDRTEIAEIASRLHVDELSLRMSLDDHSPHPTIEVLAAVIREYGLDPSWLLTGTYDPATHRIAMEGEAATIRALREFVVRPPGRIAEPTSETLFHSDQN